MPEIICNEKHEYLVDGMIKPGVSEILSAAKLINLWGIPVYALTAARDLGKEVHRITALYDRNNLKEETVDPGALPYLNAWKQYIKDKDVKMLRIEFKLYSKIFDYCGTPDRLATIGKDVVLIDLKTTTNMMPSVGPQVQAYKMLVEEDMGRKLDGVVAIQLKPDGTYQPHEYDKKNRFEERSNFLSALNNYKWRRKYKCLDAEFEREVFAF